MLFPLYLQTKGESAVVPTAARCDVTSGTLWVIGGEAIRVKIECIAR